MRFDSRATPRKSARHRNCATASSTRKARRSRIPGRLLARRDIDAFDAICDHLLVVDHSDTSLLPGRAPAVVGTYRLLRRAVADDFGGFYTASEFDIAPLLNRHANLNFLELGRSCVLAPYRNKRTVELLWQGIYNYVRLGNFDVMFGCASIEGTDPAKLAQSLSFLHHSARAPEEWRASARPERYVPMNLLSKESIDRKSALGSYRR